MATYVIGDVQGCYLTLMNLLKKISFDKSLDRIIFLGDLINRGPRSLETLRLVMDHDASMQMILGNHEIFAISTAIGALKSGRSHTLDQVFSAKDAKKLIDWLRSRPLLIKEGQNIFVHAGILPAIPLDDALEKALEVSQIIKGPKGEKFLRRFHEKTPKRLTSDMRPKKYLRLTLSYLTLIRMCENPRVMADYTGPLDKAPSHLSPWFALRDDKEYSIYFGHWAALGLYRYKNYQCLDSGSVWGEKLSALRLEDQTVFQVGYAD